MSSRRIGGQNPCRASWFALVFLKQTVEFNHPPCRDSCFYSVFLKQTVEFNCLLQKDRGKTASAAKILSPHPMLGPLPSLLIKSFFYGSLSTYEKLRLREKTIKRLAGMPQPDTRNNKQKTGVTKPAPF